MSEGNGFGESSVKSEEQIFVCQKGRQHLVAGSFASAHSHSVRIQSPPHQSVSLPPTTQTHSPSISQSEFLQGHSQRDSQNASLREVSQIPSTPLGFTLSPSHQVSLRLGWVNLRHHIRICDGCTAQEHQRQVGSTGHGSDRVRFWDRVSKGLENDTLTRYRGQSFSPSGD
jgi:hypothetical protein